MSSYYPSFNYMGVNSLKDKKLIVTHFENGDNGEVDTFLSMEPIYTESAYGTHRIDYGARYNSVAVIKITVMKSNASDFTVAEVRDFLRWTTGARQNSYLDLLEGEAIKFSFLGRVTNVLQQKLDARTIGFVIEFTSISPWAYSPQQFVSTSFGQTLTVDENGVLTKSNSTLLVVDENGVLSNGNGMFSIETDGTLYIDNSVVVHIENQSDDLYTPVYLDTTFTNDNSDYLSIKNITLDEETTIYNMTKNEVITLSSGQFILSDVPYTKIFGDDFNFIWPRLGPGINEFVISGTGRGIVEFTYRYPIKIGDCAIDINVYSDGISCGDCPDSSTSGTISGPITWNDITNTPNTIEGYGITNAYTIAEIENKLNNFDVSEDISIDESELNEMLTDILEE